jgi:hypothetical protein
MKHIITSFIAAGLLTACSTIVNHQSQDVTIRTPGAANAKCFIENEDMKYVAYTDQKIEIMKSPHDLVVSCKASGNREQTVHVKRDVNEWVVANVANGFVPGAAYDYFSRGAFDYPEIITVSFVGTPIKPYPLPEYMSDELKASRQYSTIEHIGSGEIITEADKHQKPSIMQKKENLYGLSTMSDSNINSRSSGGMALDSIHSRYNPAVSYDPTEEDK